MRKKMIAFLVLILFTGIIGKGQQFIKTTTPCNNELLKKTPGEWVKTWENKYGGAKVTTQERKEILNRVKTIHQWIKDIYPSPTAVDASLFLFTTDKLFVAELKMEHLSEDRLDWSEKNGIPVIMYSCGATFCSYHCGRNANEIMRGKGCETSTNVSVDMNSLSNLFVPLPLDGNLAEIMVIDGRPIKILSPIIGKWKGYDVYNPHGVTDPKTVLLHREGALPYIPVTRQQYLGRSIQFFQRFFDKTLRAIENPEGLATLMDKKEREEQVKKIQKMRDDVIKYYQDELNTTTKAGLLESPAIIFGDITGMLTSNPIFTTQDKGGKMLVTENPAYLKQELPKYIPQFIVYRIDNCDVCYPDPALNPFKLLDENFPIEKLQAMIDK
jgi:hypothetical protein